MAPANARITAAMGEMNRPTAKENTARTLWNLDASAMQQIHLAPHPADIGLPWGQQRLRVVDVEVKQQGVVLYHAHLDDHQAAAMAKPQVDPDGIDPPLPPSGPTCGAELPQRIHVEVPNKSEDVQFRYESVTWNPPLTAGMFTQTVVPAGLEPGRVDCED